MRKSVICFTLLLIPLLMSACARKKHEIETPAVGMPNPIKESSAEEIKQTLGFQFSVPDDSSNVQYSIIGGTLAQMDFVWKESKCTARIKKSSSVETEDISGFYYNWSNETSGTVANNPSQIKWKITDVGDIVGICIWKDKSSDLTYSVSMRQHADSVKLAELANAIYVVNAVKVLLE